MVGQYKRISLLLAMILIFTVWLPALAAENAASAAGGAVMTREELNRPGRKVGVSTGSASMLIVEKELPEAEIVYFEDNVSAYEAVAQGKIDAYVFARWQMQLAIDSGLRGVHLLEENMDEEVRVAAGISPVTKIPDLGGRLNAFIAEKKADGTLEDMYQRWSISHDEKMPDIAPVQNPQYRLTVGTSGTVPPYSYYIGVDLAGYDIELAHRFAAWLGADLAFKVYDYGAIIPAAVTGDVDCIMANLNVTPERAEALPFSDELYSEEIGIMVRGEASAAFGNSIRDSFNKTFVRENRWQLFVSGIRNTQLITVLSILFGAALGFGVFMLCRNGNPVANGITGVSLWLVQGTPMVVLLMILYYIIFGSITVSGLTVAMIGFTLTFGAAVFSLLKMGVGAVDSGQYEAAYALGYSNRRTFYRIILPQALPHVISAYRGEIIGLIKATAVVGYIAVQDLTKMGDIVRSRTYEAFFPLIAVTAIYFVLEGLFGLLVSRIGIRLDPKHRSPEHILKGVKTDD